MGIGSSGRIVIEVDTSVKRELYGTLASEGKSLKEWFLANALTYIEQGRQIPLSLDGKALKSGSNGDAGPGES